MWKTTPESTFETRDGKSVSFIDYYKNHHNIKIGDVRQPMLVNRDSKLVPGFTEKQDHLVVLVPELCYMTGLTDEMRADFKVRTYCVLLCVVPVNLKHNKCMNIKLKKLIRFFS